MVGLLTTFPGKQERRHSGTATTVARTVAGSFRNDHLDWRFSFRFNANASYKRPKLAR